MGELFLSHNAFYALNGYGAVHIGKKRRQISIFYDADGKSPSIHKTGNPFEPVRSYLFSTTI